ncbi:unnamed protein product, partial [Tuber aestivum]
MKLGTVSFLLAVTAVFSIGVEVEAADDDKPSGLNPISYPLGGNVNAGSPVTITWQPSTPGTVTIHALKGPPDNLNDLGPIVLAKISNSGSFVWNVPKTFEDSATMGAGNKYGLKIIDDATGKFEYSPPFDMTVPGSTFGDTAAGAKTSSEVHITTAAKESASTIAPASISASATKETSDVESRSTGTTEPTESSAGGILGGGGGGGRFNLKKLPDLGLIFAASGAGVAGIIIITVIAVVWARIRRDRKKAGYYNPKSFRDRRSHLEAETPIIRAHHRRMSSTSSFGDGARASEVFSMHNRSPPPPPPPPLMPTAPPLLRNPPPRLGPPLVPPGPSPPSGPQARQIPLSPPPPISPLPTALLTPRNPSYSVDFPFPSQPCAPYAPRVHTPAGANFETHAL